MRHSTYVRNFIAMALVFLVSFFMLGGVFFTWSRSLIMQERRKSMSVSARETVRYINAQSPRFNYDLSAFEIRMLLTALSGISGFDILIADTSGLVVSCSDEQFNSPYIGKSVPGDVLALVASRQESAFVSQLGGLYGESRYITAVPLVAETSRGDYIFGYMFLTSEIGTMIDIWRQFAGVFLVIAGIVMTLTFLISLVMSKKMSAPINAMALAAHRFARGDFDVRVKETGRADEIGQLMQAFNAMADSLERSESLRREFVANVSHELKTPMTVIAGFADGILDGTVPPENERKYLEIISSETRRLSRLVRGMLDTSRFRAQDREELLKESFDIAEVIRVTLLGFSGRLEERGLDAAVDLPEEPVIVRGDKDSINQVVYNLLDNAIKFADDGSEIRISLWKQGAKAFVAIEDRGGVIPENEMPLIFDRFHKTDRSRSADREGVGLGLYIVKTILDNHNEDIYVTSDGGMTRFVFTLSVVD
ncbi:MAG: HAMP domain-containing histidine kinase [Oscillospiraceae bacterium]|nr:HAMP domain-containing histidine kinase [Oscillospiraceae bacterium]